MAAKLPEQTLADLRAAFISMDSNGDGRLQHDEFRKAVKETGVPITEQELDNTVDSLDMNGNGYIDYTEFLAASMNQEVFLKEENVRQAFSYFDKVSFVTVGQKRKDHDQRTEEHSAGHRGHVRRRTRINHQRSGLQRRRRGGLRGVHHHDETGEQDAVKRSYH